MDPDINFQPPVASVSVANMVNMRTAVIARFTQALELITEAEEMASKAHLGSPSLLFEDGTRGTREKCSSGEARTMVVQAVDRYAWQYLMSESGLRTFMDQQAREQWDKNIRQGEVPALSADNVEATFRSIHGMRMQMFERGVIECFRRLSWNYKTNEPFAFGKRIIIDYLFTRWGNAKQRWLSLNHDRCHYLDDLVRVFTVVDGKPEPDHRQGVYSLLTQADHKQEREAEHEYFSIKWYLKGTGHVTFKRPDLVQRLNDIISRHYAGMLPDGRRGADR